MTVFLAFRVIPSNASRIRSPRRKRLRFVLLSLLLSNLVECSKGPGCDESATREALDQALNIMFAESRKLAKVDVTVNDIVVVNQTTKQASCKALLHIAVDFLGLQKEKRDSTIEYVTEITEQGRTLVTITSLP